jgi:nicotinamidase/pyrazinamidase
MNGKLMKDALILVDIQNDFFPGGALAVPNGDEVIPVANRLARHFDLVVATQDWHPPNHISFAVNHPGRKVGDVIHVDGLEQVLWPTHCVQGTAGAQFPPALDASRIARIFRNKGADPTVDSYSGFFDNGRRNATGLDEFLRASGVEAVYLVGLATEYCVRATAIDAAELGFQTYVVEDGCRAVDLNPGDGRRAIERMKSAGVRVIRSDKLVLHSNV